MQLNLGNLFYTPAVVHKGYVDPAMNATTSNVKVQICL